MNGNSRRLMIVGLDGATWTILDRLIGRGSMPVLGEMISRGVRGALRSVVPCNSAAAWASFATGKGPAGHGVFEFRHASADSDRLRRVVSASSVRSETLWAMLNRKGYRVAVLNVPAVTYPVSEVDGFMVSGMLTPRLDEGFAHPASVREKILARTGGRYVIDSPWRLFKDRPGDLMQDIEDVTAQRLDVLSALLGEEEWDVACVVLESPDRLQHCMWRYMDPGHPRYSEPEAAIWMPRVERHFQELDAAIGRFLSMLAEDAAVMVVSDHGFRSSEWQVLVNGWLAAEGYLQIAGGGGLRSTLLGMDHPLVLRLRRRISRMVSDEVRTRVARRPSIDWEKTRAYCPWDHQQAVRINLAGRDPGGIVDPEDYGVLVAEIREKLRAWRNPQTGAHVVDRVLTGRELYGEDLDPRVPDLVFLTSDGHRVAPPLNETGPQLGSTGWASGDHDLPGILVASGGPFSRSRERVDADLVDVLPSALFALGETVPDDLDGRVREDLFSDAFLASRRVAFEHARAGAEHAERSLSEEDEEKLTESLRNLGYLE